MTNTTPLTRVTPAQRRVLDALEERGCDLRGKSALCPGHEDHDPSLAAAYSGERRCVILHCHAGCELDQILGALALEETDLFDEDRPNFVADRGARHSSLSSAPSPPNPNEGGGIPSSTVNPSPKPSPCPCNDVGQEPEMYGLLSDHRDGPLAHVRPVTLAAPTEPLTPDEASAGQFIALAVALREAVCEYRPLICSARFLAGQLGWRHPNQASRALRGLREKGVVRSAGGMPGTGTALVEVVRAERHLALIEKEAA